MNSYKCAWLALFCLLLVSSAYSQSQDTAAIGSASGTIKDAEANGLIPRATVSIYRAADSSLVSYQLSNNYGAFHFARLPTGTTLEIIISHVGYVPYNKQFVIPANSKSISLPQASLVRRSVDLNEVVIRRPPVQMNGDTLEFNAEAFQLDKNAVVEDLLRKLPNVTVWGDGKITVNGKTVENIYVEGKPFFGTNGSIATQNLPKNVVDKIQVYKKADANRSELDSILNVNIKLKKGQKRGLFGKVGYGQGTDKHYAADGMFSTFTPRTQLSLVASANDVNAMAKDLATLMRTSSFKGVGVNIEYQPDFSVQGLNKSKTAGVDFLHYLVPDLGPSQNNHIAINYFVSDQQTSIERSTHTLLDLGNGLNLSQLNQSTSQIATRQHQLNLRYVLQNQKIEFYVMPSLYINNSNNHRLSSNQSEIVGQNPQSTSTTDYQQRSDANNITFKSGFNNKVKYFKIDYTFYLGHQNDAQTNVVNFQFPQEPSQNSYLNRKYQPENRQMTHELDFKYDNLKKQLFGDSKLPGLVIGFVNYFKSNAENNSNMVLDLDTISHQRFRNSYLSNTGRYSFIDERPGIKFERAFTQTLTNRYKKVLYFYTEFREQFFFQKNVSEKDFQNFRRNYNTFLPKASVNYRNDQFGDHEITYEINYNTFSDYPTVSRLVPLVDSANIYYLQRGNPDLKPSYKNELGFWLSYISFVSSKIVDNFKIGVRAGMVKNAFADSTIYDLAGRAENYTVNVNGNKYLSASGDFQKAYKFSVNQLQVTGNTSIYMGRQPNFINNVPNISNITTGDHALGLIYTYKDVFAIEVKERMTTFRSKQEGLNNQDFKNTILKTIISASGNAHKRVSLSSNISFNKNKSTYSPVTRFAIWNASVGYRFLPGNQAEIKFSALDMLHQNTSIINFGYNNSLTTGTVNVLQQYFMITLAYFPRKFGKTK